MKQTNNTLTGNKTNHSLHNLVNEAIKELSQLQGSHQIHLENNVPPDLSITTDKGVLILIIRGLLYSLVANATEGDIHISAREMFGNTIKISIKDNNCYNTYAVACALQKIVPVAEGIGGFLNITNQRQKITTIEFSFPMEKETQFSNEED